MAEQRSGVDPRLRALTFRLRTAEESLLTANLYCKITHLKTTAANLTLSKLKHQEEAELVTAMGQGFHDKMKEDEAALALNQRPKAARAGDSQEEGEGHENVDSDRRPREEVERG